MENISVEAVPAGAGRCPRRVSAIEEEARSS